MDLQRQCRTSLTSKMLISDTQYSKPRDGKTTVELASLVYYPLGATQYKVTPEYISREYDLTSCQTYRFRGSFFFSICWSSTFVLVPNHIINPISLWEPMHRTEMHRLRKEHAQNYLCIIIAHVFLY